MGEVRIGNCVYFITGLDKFWGGGQNIFRPPSSVIVHHLQRHCPDVLVWRQAVFVTIERKDYSWVEYQMIQCVAPGGRGSNPAHYMLCHAFNSRVGCPQKAHHDGLLHYRSYCDLCGSVCDHWIVSCRGKVM